MKDRGSARRRDRAPHPNCQSFASVTRRTISIGPRNRNVLSWSLGTFTTTLEGNYLVQLDAATGQVLWGRRLEGDGRSPQSRQRRAYVNALGCDAAGLLYMSVQGVQLDSLGNLPTAVTSRVFST